ncbi:MAG: DUF1963 domain-containing protein, partial [Proteobacteria bacterium]|nr:DUF1963 domain-containing protein [Pseudomonadota bacterium]
ETPAAPVFNEIKPETPAAPVFNEIKPETPAAPVFNEIKPETPAAPVFNEIAPQAPAAPVGPRWSDFTAPQSVQAQDPEAGMSMTERIVHRLRKHRFEPNILLNFDRRPHALLDTKIGGPYYVPEDKKVPRNLQTDGELFLLAQINFATMPKQPDFPTDGLLQFFIDPDPHAFAAHKHPTQQTAWRVRYIPEVPSYTSIATNGYKPDTSQFEGKLTTMPFDCRRFLMLKGSDTQQFICWDDFPFQAMLDRYCSDLLPANPSDSDMMALRTARMDAMNQLRREFKPGKAQDFVIQMGGYPTFHGKNDIRMEDPRFPGIRTPNVLLLQLPSFDGFQWGGDRIVHFFISRKDLRERNFNHVMTDI